MNTPNDKNSANHNAEVFTQRLGLALTCLAILAICLSYFLNLGGLRVIGIITLMIGLWIGGVPVKMGGRHGGGYTEGDGDG